MVIIEPEAYTWTDSSNTEAEEPWSEVVHDFLEYHSFGDSATGLGDLDYYLAKSGVLKKPLKMDPRYLELDGFFSSEAITPKEIILKKILYIEKNTHRYPDNSIREYFNESKKLLLASIKHDPKYKQAYFDLALIYEENQMADEGIFYLKKLLALIPDDKEAHLFLGLLLYKTGRMDSSYSEYERAIKLMSEKEKRDFLYNTSKEFLEPYLEDSINSISSDSLQFITIKYWESRDPLYLTDYNERLLAHIARVTYANLRFSVPRLGIKGSDSYRGIALIRYGFPYAIIRLRGNMNIDIWEYKDKIFYFTDEYMNGNFKLGIPDITPHWNAQNILLNQLKNQLPPVYKPKFDKNALDIPYNIVQFKDPVKNRSDIFFNYALKFSNNWVTNGKYNFNHEVGVFLFNKYFEPVFHKAAYQLPVDYNNKINAGGQNYSINTLQVKSMPDSGKVSFEVMRNTDSAVASYRKYFEIKNFDEKALEISDILLASDVETGRLANYPVTRKNITILPNPLGSFNKDQKLFIYYEIYNLDLGKNGLTNFRQNIILKSIDNTGTIKKIFSPILKLIGIDSKEKKILLTSDYHTKNKNSQIYLQLDMSNYDPGNYLLTVRIKDNITGTEKEQSVSLSWQ